MIRITAPVRTTSKRFSNEEMTFDSVRDGLKDTDKLSCFENSN